MGLLKDQGVDIPEPRVEKIKGVVDDIYIFIHSQRLAGVLPHDPEPEHAPEQEEEQEIPQEEEQHHDIPHQFASFDFAAFQAYMAQYEQRAVERAQR
jgi:hypothetical protein